MNHRESNTNLKDIGINKVELDRFFDTLRLEYFEDPTTDSDRNVHWLHRFSAFELPDNNNPDGPTSPFFLVLSVNFELVIGDAPDVLTSANFDYYFNGVHIELRDSKSNEPLGTMPLKVSTIGELKAFLSMLQRGKTVPK
jgi:hypothetical protein